jgi:hypothetical protein
MFLSPFAQNTETHVVLSFPSAADETQYYHLPALVGSILLRPERHSGHRRLEK